jgi:hypothetical protein
MDSNNTEKLNVFDWIALILVVIGALNWASIGIFDYDFVASVFGTMTSVTRTIYVLVGLSGLYLAFASPTWCRRNI